nr:hypothetical protein [Candidatus Sigynarchaeum springense]
MLDRKGSAVTVVPAGIDGCRWLRELELAQMEVKTLPAELALCKNLEKIRHRHLHRSAVPPAVWNMPCGAFVQDLDMTKTHRPIREDDNW